MLCCTVSYASANEYIKIIYVNCTLRNEHGSNLCSNENYFSSSENKAWVFFILSHSFLNLQFTVIDSSLHRFITSQHNDQLPVSLLAQLVEQYTAWYCRDHGFKSHTGLNFLRPYIHYCSSDVHYCKDHFHIHILVLCICLLVWFFLLQMQTVLREVIQQLSIESVRHVLYYKFLFCGV